jgi:beta-lactamase class A
MSDATLIAALTRLGASLGDGALLGIAAECDGEATFFNADTLFPTASTIKAAIVLEACLQQEEGRLELSQPAPINDTDIVGGSGVLQSLTRPLHLPLTDLAALAISVSDNTASNAVLRAVGGPGAVNARMRDAWGMTHTTIHRPIQFTLGPDDPPHTATTTPRDFLRLLRVLSETAPSSSRVRAWMGTVSDTSMLPRRLVVNPYAADLRLEHAEVAVYHKPGAVTGVRNDIGLIVCGDRTLRVAAFTKGVIDPRWTVDNVGCLAIAHAAEHLCAHYFAASE